MKNLSLKQGHQVFWMEVELLISIESADLRLLKSTRHFYEYVCPVLPVRATLVLKGWPKMSIETDWSFRNFFYFSNKLCICYVNFFIKLGSSFHLAQYGTPGSSVAQHLARAFKVPCSVAWQKKLCKMLIFSKLCLVSSTICKENTEFHKEIIEKLLQDLPYKSPFHFQGTNWRRTHNVIFLSRDGFSDSIIFLCCKNTHSSLLFIILFTAIRHFPIYFTLLCNFFWQLISLFDSWPVMSSLFFLRCLFGFFFPPTRRCEHIS